MMTAEYFLVFLAPIRLIPGFLSNPQDINSTLGGYLRDGSAKVTVNSRLLV